MEKTDIKNLLVDAYRGMNGEENSAVKKIRSEAMEYFEKTGFPTIKWEDWKYTNVSFLNRIEFRPNFDNPELEPELIESLDFERVDTYRAVLVNGKFRREYSKLPENSNLQVLALEDALGLYIPVLNEYYGKIADFSVNPFTAVNTALAQNGIFIHAPKNFALDKPIEIMIINDSREFPSMSQARIFVNAEQGSDLKIIETGHNLGEHNGFTNIVGEIKIGANARFDHYRLQDAGDNAYTFSNIRAVLERDSVMKNYTFNMSGKFTRNNLGSVLDGENIESHYLGVFIGKESEFIDNHTFVDHAKPNSYSNENYKGLLDDRSTGVFNGKILVRKDAQKTNAYQSNKNVLLSNSATINTKPELEIYADDVKCSHGATSGALDEEPLFYLRSRGIDETKALTMLLNAFVDEVILQISVPELKDYLLERAEEKLEDND
jgi:Fe-S cluster assembly protein SufD